MGGIVVVDIETDNDPNFNNDPDSNNETDSENEINNDYENQDIYEEMLKIIDKNNANYNKFRLHNISIKNENHIVNTGLFPSSPILIPYNR